jgi:hypothetical protein
MAQDRVIDRSPLHFPEEVQRHFSFLQALGFRCVHSDATFVRYKSPEIAVNVYHGRRSYEIGLEIESAQVPGESYSIFEILQLVDGKRAKGYRNYATHTVEGVAEGTHRLAVLFRECIDRGILNDKQLFSQLKLQRRDLTNNYWFEMELKQAREKSESAWARKDFEKVVQILSPLQEHLNPFDIKKLEYAKKHRNAS